VVDGGGEPVCASCLIDGQLLRRVVGEVTGAVRYVDLDARARRQDITAAERHAVRQQKTAFHLSSTHASNNSTHPVHSSSLGIHYHLA